MTELQTLLRFEPYYKPVIWGGSKIASMKNLRPFEQSIGESWEISAVPGMESVVDRGSFRGQTITRLIETYGAALVGRGVYDKWGNTFPLLIKFIDARRDLSIQVHPDDSLAQAMHKSRGKTEMWYVVDAAPGSAIYAGLSGDIKPGDFVRCAADGSIVDRVSRFPARKGQFYYIPAGTVHAIGAGTLVAEIQETSDISYRIYDYGRTDADGNPRPLHIDEACKAVDFGSVVRPPVNVKSLPHANIIECDFFAVDYVSPALSPSVPMEFDAADGSFTVLMAVHGDIECIIGGRRHLLPVGNTGLIPADVRHYSIRASQPFLLIYHPAPVV